MEIKTEVLPDFEIDLSDIVLDEEQAKVKVEEVEEEKKEEEQEIVPDPLAKSFYEELTQRGYLDENENFSGTWEELDELITDLPQRVLNSVIATMPEDSKQVLKFISAAGSDLNKEELKKFFNEYFNEAELPNVDTADSAREFLTSVFQEQGLKPRAIQAQLDDLEDEDKLIEEAKKIVEQRGSKTEQLIQEKEKEVREKKLAEQQFVRSIQEEIKAQNWKPERTVKVQSTFSNINTLMQAIASNPKAYVQFADLMTYFDMNKKEFNLGGLTKEAETKAASSLKETILKNGFSSAGATSKQTTPDKNNNNTDNLIPII